MSHPKHASADHDILDVIRHRWSPRAFDPARDVELPDLQRLFEAARWAPSSYNDQPWRFVACHRRLNPAAYDALLGTVDPGNRTWAQHAPVLVLVAINLKLKKTGAANQHAWYDAGQAVAFLTLQATGVGMAVRQMEGFDRERAREACAIPADVDLAVVMAIGYAGEPELLPSEKHRTAERQPRRRDQIGDFVFDGKWGKNLESEI